MSLSRLSLSETFADRHASLGSQIRQLDSREIGPATTTHDDGASNSRQFPQLRPLVAVVSKCTQACETFTGESRSVAARPPVASAFAPPVTHATTTARRESGMSEEQPLFMVGPSDLERILASTVIRRGSVCIVERARCPRGQNYSRLGRGLAQTGPLSPGASSLK